MPNISNLEGAVVITVAILAVINTLVGVTYNPITVGYGPNAVDVRTMRDIDNRYELDALVANIEIPTYEIAKLAVVSVDVLGAE